MSSFTTRLEVSPMPDGRHWRLLRTFSYDVGRKGRGVTIKVPAGFLTDFASSPPAVWWLIPPWGKYGKAAVLHDYLYQNHTNVNIFNPANPPGSRYRVTITREYADNIFREAMIVLGVAPWRCSLMYWGVRAFGWLAWK